jgi:hypothetical protein
MKKKINKDMSYYQIDNTRLCPECAEFQYDGILCKRCNYSPSKN